MDWPTGFAPALLPSQGRMLLLQHGQCLGIYHLGTNISHFRSTAKPRNLINLLFSIINEIGSPGRYRPFFTDLKGRCITLMLQGNLKFLVKVKIWHLCQELHLVQHLRRVRCIYYTTGIKIGGPGRCCPGCLRADNATSLLFLLKTVRK